MIWLEVAAWLPAAAWLYLLIGRGRYWMTDLHLSGGPEPTDWPAVTVIVPARDEATMLARTLPALLNQDYPGLAEVLLVDDCSTDGTADVAAGGRLPLQVIRGVPRPPRWVGKTWALEQGYRAARSMQPAPEFLLFTDADIAHPTGSLRALVTTALRQRADLVSQMARLRTDTGWEKVIVPAFVYFFSQLYPFRSVARPRNRTAAAAGGCVLVRRDALERAGGIGAISTAIIDDVALGQAVKRSGGHTLLVYATDMESIRPYPQLADLWDMVARSAYTQLQYSPPALVGAVVGLLVIYGGWFFVLIAGAVAANAAVVAGGVVAWALMTFSYLPMTSYYRLGRWRTVLLPFAAVLYGAMTLDSARRHRRGTGAAWKGRTYTDSRSGTDPAAGHGATAQPTDREIAD